MGRMSSPRVSVSPVGEEEALAKAIEAPHVEAAQVVRYLYDGEVGKDLRTRLFRHLALGCEVCCGVLEQVRVHPEKPHRREKLLQAELMDPLAFALDRWLTRSAAAAANLRPAHRYWSEHALNVTFGFCRLTLEETRWTAHDFYQACSEERAAAIHAQARSLFDDWTLAKLAPRLFADFQIYALAGLRLYRFVEVDGLDARDKVRRHLASCMADAETAAGVVLMGYEPVLGDRILEPTLQKLRQSPISGLDAQLRLYQGRKRGDLGTCRAALEAMPSDVAPILRLKAYHWTSVLALAEGEALEAYRLFQEAGPLYDTWGKPADQASRLAGLARCAASLGDLEAGERLIKPAIEDLLTAGKWSEALASLVELHRILSCLDRGKEIIRHERAFARRIRGGIPSEAIREFTKRVRFCREQRMPLARIYAACDEACRAKGGLPRVIRFGVSA